MNIVKRKEKLRVVRQNGFIPGVLYGKDFSSTSIQAPLSEFVKALNEYGTSKTFSIKIEGKKHIVYIKDYQSNLMNAKKYIHFDLLKVSADDTLHAYVSTHYVGKENMAKSSSVFTSNLDELEIEYAVGSGISSIDVDVSSLTEDSPIYVKDIAVPKGIKIVSDPEAIVCSLLQATVYEEETEETDEPTQFVTVPAEE